MNRALRGGAAASLLALVAACGAPAAAPKPAPSPKAAVVAMPCVKLPDAVLPHSAGMLTEQQRNAAYCLPRGQRVDVFLSAVKGSQWQPVQASGEGVLTPASTGVMTAPLGVTPAMFVGATDGTAVLTSATASGTKWTVTLVVKG